VLVPTLITSLFDVRQLSKGVMPPIISRRAQNDITGPDAKAKVKRQKAKVKKRQK
jgi:hypothetical protein